MKARRNQTAQLIIRMTGVFGLTAFLVAAISAQQITLISNGKSGHVILVSEKAEPAERYAAAELQKYLGQMTGSRLPVVNRAGGKPFIAIGDHPAAKSLKIASLYAGDDGFRQLTRGRNVFLKGATARASLYAVYDFLEKQGCWWFTPATAPLVPHHELVPARNSLIVKPMNVLSRPLIRYRRRDGAEGTRSQTPENWRAVIDWLGKARVNTLSLNLPAYEKDRHVYIEEAGKRGIDLEVGKHDVMNRFLPRATYFAQHPEWFGMIDGKRTLRARGKAVMFETANSEAVKTFTDNIVAYLENRPEISVFQMWAPDAALWSESPESLALGTPAERNAALVQHVAREVKRAGLKTRVAFLAYSFYTDAPRNMNFERDAVIEFCPINQNFSFRLDDRRSTANAKYYGQLTDWLKRFPGEVSLYTYYAKYSWRSLPVALPEQIFSEMHALRNAGVVGTNMYCEPGHWLAYEINELAVARASWEENPDAARWYESYLRARYGNAAEPMKRYHEIATRISLEALIAQSATKDKTRDFLTEFEQAQIAIGEARSRADTPQAKWLTEKLAWQIDYLAAALRFRRAQLAENKTEADRLRGEIQKLVAPRANDGTTLERGYGYQLAQEPD